MTPAAPVLGKLRLGFVAQGALAGTALALYALVLLQAGFQHQDLDAYLAAGRDTLSGHPLYAVFLQHPFPDPTLRPAYIYPPIFAILVSPLALLPQSVAGALWLLLNQLCLAASLLIVIRWLRPSPLAIAMVIAATVTFYPLWVDAVQGQANLPLLLLVTLGVAGVIRGESRFAIAIGAAAALKLTPAILLIWLALDRRLKPAAWMLAGFGALTLIGALLRFRDTLVFFTQVVPSLAPGTAVYANQSLAGFLERILTANPYTTPWLAIPWTHLVVVLLAIGLIGIWFWRTREQTALIRVAAFLPLAPLLSSVSWPHHLVILLPVIWLSVIAIATREWPIVPTVVLAGLLLLFDVASRVSVGPPFKDPGFRLAQTTDPIVFAAANVLFFATLTLFFAGPWLLRSR